MELDPDGCWRVVTSRDRRFDGRFVTAVRTTGIYCRPSCPAQPPKRANVRFYRCAAAAVAAGFRACRRCRPDAAPGSREWDVRGDLAARALRAIGAGVVDEVGVPGLAGRLHVSQRHLHRTLVGEIGAGPLALARTRRAQTARLLLTATDLPATRIAFAAGFGSVRQFNHTIREQFGCAPADLRRRGGTTAAAGEPPGVGSITLRLAHRTPYDTIATLQWLALHAIPGVEAADDASYRRVSGDGTVLTLRPAPDGEAWSLSMTLDEVARVGDVVAAGRRLLDSDADPAAVAAALGDDPLLGPLVRRRPGLRVPGAAEPWQQLVATIIGQQVSLRGARTLTGRLVSALGEPLAEPVEGLSHRFPTPQALASASYDGIGLTSARARTLRAVAREVADGRIDLTVTADRADTLDRLTAVLGIGPWTAAMVALRGLGDPDAWPDSDLVLRRAVTAAGADPARWRPWRGYAAMHLWAEHLTRRGVMT